MSRYSELHPALVDEMMTRSVLSSLPPPLAPTLTETSSLDTKRGRSSTDDEPPTQAKKSRHVNKIKNFLQNMFAVVMLSLWHLAS